MSWPSPVLSLGRHDARTGDRRVAQERLSPPQGSGLRRWLDSLHDAFEGRILPFGDEAAVVCAAMHIPDPKSYRDSMIAAAAVEHSFTLVTRKVRDFEKTGAKLFNPWPDASG